MAKKSEESTENLERKTVAGEKLKALQLTLDKLEKTYFKNFKDVDKKCIPKVVLYHSSGENIDDVTMFVIY